MAQHISDQSSTRGWHDGLVLTEKTGLFSGVLAAKSMFLEIKIEFAFEFWRFLEIFHIASRCRAVTNIVEHPSKKIIPKSLR
jgi:hypothetical protein